LSSYPTIKNIEQWDNWKCVFEATAKAQGVNNVLDLKYNPSNPAEGQLFDAQQNYIYTVLLLVQLSYDQDIEQWDNWKRVFEATAKAQWVNNVLDLKYNPSNPAEGQLFDTQQNYIYAVLLNTVKDSFLKSIIINHNNRNVQDCWEKIIAACESTTSAEIKANSLLQYITSVKFDDGKWRGTSKDFIKHWCEQLQQYSTLCSKPGTVTQFTDPLKVQMLQNTLDGIPRVLVSKHCDSADRKHTHKQNSIFL